jgi:hypothetical protein
MSAMAVRCWSPPGRNMRATVSLAHAAGPDVLPALPDRQRHRRGLRARVTDLGQRHPVTRGLPGAEAEPPRWSAGSAMIGVRESGGETS